MTNEEQDTLRRNGLDVSSFEFNRDKLLDRFEAWLEQLKVETVLPSISRGAP